jgi:hypothetical protein
LRTDSAETAITGVTLIDPSQRTVTPDATVVLRGDRIAAVGQGQDAALPPHATTVDGRGRFLIPGLWDMHVHGSAGHLPLYLACGVTGVREMGPAPASVDLREEIRSGRRLGPRLVIGDPVDAPDSVIDWVRSAADEDSAVAVVSAIQAQGADFIKVFSFLEREPYLAIAGEADGRGIPFGGHVPYAVTVEEAATAGQWTIEHLTGVLHGASDRESELLGQFARVRRSRASLLDWVRLWFFEQARSLLDSHQPDRLRHLLEVFREQATWHVPTLVGLRDFRYFDDLPHQADERRRWVAPDYYAFFAEFATDFAKTVPHRTRFEARDQYRLEQQIVAEMHGAGVGLLAGTDGPPCLPPGLSLHEELALLVDAGLPPMEALRTATRNPALALGLEEMGKIEAGAAADLVLLAADPLADIRNTQRIEAVVAAGQLLDRAALDRLLAQQAAACVTAWDGA